MTTTNPSPRVPVVLPHLRVTVHDDGSASVTLDGESYDAAQSPEPGAQHRWHTRDTVPALIEHIAAQLASPVRVDVTDGGTTYTDIITPGTDARPEPAGQPELLMHGDARGSGEAAPAAHPLARMTGCTVTGTGFIPAERVAVAVVIGHHPADATGAAVLRLPPALLAGRAGQPGLVVLIGETSGTLSRGVTPSTGVTEVSP